MAGWLRSRAKLATILSLLKDQTSATLARTSGPFSHLHSAIITATNHTESLPDEPHVEQILAAGAGSRMQVSSCTRLLVKRLRKTHSWAVALKCLVILHRSLLDGGFLFQDLLSYTAVREGREYLTFAGSQSSQDLEECVWVKTYARYLDERLRCAHALKTHLDSRWKGEIAQTRVEFMESGELLHQLEALQDLLHELCQCAPDGDVGENSAIQGALVLVVTDSYKVQDEVEFRVREMIGRVSSLSISESVAVLQRCKRAEGQAQELRGFLEQCRGLRLLRDIPLLREPVVRKVEIQELTETIQELQKEPQGVSYGRSASGGGKGLSGRVPPQSAARKPFRIEGPGNLTRTSSQPLSHLPRRAAAGATNGSRSREFPLVPEDQPHTRRSSVNLIDLSYDSEPSNVEKSRAPPQNTFRDLITF